MEEERFQIRKILSHKQYHYILVCTCVSFFLIIFLELSYSETFKTYQAVFVLFFILVEAVTVNFLQYAILKELLLVAPIVGAFEIIQFVTIMASNDFLSFVIFYTIRLSLLVAMRTYVDPFLKNILFFSVKIATYLSTLHPRLQRLLAKYTTSSDYDKQLGCYIQEYAENKKSQNYQEENSLEPMLTLLLNYSIKALSLFLRPLIILMIYVYPLENQIPTLYGVRVIDLKFYLMFAFVVALA